MSEHLPPSSRRLRRMASDYEESFSEARAEQIAARALARARAEEVRPRRRLAVLVGVASLMFVFVGLGYGSARSLPGDPLYGVSRTYEHFGQLVGVVDPVQERLHEVIALAERGDRQLAAETANEALQELGRQRGVTASFPSTVDTTPSTVPSPSPTSPTAPPPTAPDDEENAPAVVPDDTTTTTVESSITVDAAEEDVEDDPIKSLKLAAQLLLDRVKENGEAVDDAAANLAVAVSALESDEDPTTEAADDSVTTSTSSTTSTTQPQQDSTTSTTSTSSSTTSSTTSTTIPGGEPPGEGDGSEPGDEGPGPIIMPPEF